MQLIAVLFMLWVMVALAFNLMVVVHAAEPDIARAFPVQDLQLPVAHPRIWGHRINDWRAQVVRIHLYI